MLLPSTLVSQDLSIPMLLLFPGVFCFAWCLKDTAYVLPLSCFLLWFYTLVGRADGVDVFASIVAAGKGNQNGLCLFFFLFFFNKENDLLYLWKLILWVEFLGQECFSLAFINFFFNLLHFFRPPGYSVFKNQFIAYSKVGFLQSIFWWKIFIWCKIICILKAEDVYMVS